jgi:hypothetical protein
MVGLAMIERSLISALVAPPGDRKQQPEVEQRDGDHDRRFKHRRRLLERRSIAQAIRR